MLWFIYIFLLGLIVGSFVNVVIYRIPRGRSIVSGRSQCPSCSKKISWYDLIPLASFLILGGRCRACGKKISPAYPAIELYSGFVFVISYWFFAGSGWIAWVSAIFILELFLILAIIDLRHLILPDSLLIILLVGAAVWSLAQKLVDRAGHWQVFDINSLAGTGVLFTIFFLVWLFSKGRGLGFGDVKLAGIIGLIFGFWGGLIILYLAVAVGAVLGLTLLLTHQANLKTKLPLGTLICFSASFYILCGNIVLNKLSLIFYTIPSILK